MTKHILAGCFGETDTEYEYSKKENEQLSFLDFLTGKKSLRFGIGSTIKQLDRLNIYPSEVALDLLILAIMVQAADVRLNRIQSSQDAWTREIHLIVPVSDIELWQKCKSLLKIMLRFLTGDLWEIDFRMRPEGFESLIKEKSYLPYDYDGLSLFSGGLDSLIGAIDALESGITPLFISHAGEGAVSSPQRAVFEKLINRYPQSKINRLRFPSAHFPKNLFSDIKSENSTRGRSFLFFALGVFAGSGLKKTFDLRIPENGLIALNVPLDPTRLGSLSTRTTHSYYIHRWNELLQILNIPGKMFNPYWDKTKGEMTENCSNQDFLKSIVHLSVSCAHPSASRYRNGGIYHHCGHCVPCIIRRAALNHAWQLGEDTTSYSPPDIFEKTLDSRKAEGIQIRAFQYALINLNNKPGYLPMLIHKPGPLLEDIAILNDLMHVYKRGMKEVENLLQGVVTTPN
ncbi:hypothetical protein B1207_15810 [Legionella quinlivanii]|uniref:7-cyano-7-deazaguanine synthase n=1 Tax=Legionella quinlivanii TaxID=45073 RepID=A0A364LFH4_9GAMM|nr:Qat anti-phage system QueC-like protein QatC [Legionella quinlivanii]RAP34403.1 hypothetical protein B1207_15810 [Legionella quinlivanii]